MTDTAPLATEGLGRIAAQRAEKYLKELRLWDKAQHQARMLSGGMKRRLMIARAMMNEPRLLILDEPTAGVDAVNQHVLADVLGRLVERDVTLVIVTHELGALEGLPTRIIVVDGGRLAFDGDLDRYAAARDAVHHDHDSHHHDLELVQPPAMAHGPFDPPAGTP